MAVAIPFVMLGLTALSAASSAKAGADSAAAQKQQAKYEAVQYQTAANNTMATGERQATEERKKAALAISRAQAVAGGSGGGVDDPTVSHILGNLAGEGEYNALSDLFGAQTQADNYKDQAAVGQWEARSKASATQRSGLLSAIGTAYQGGSSFMSKYGEGTGTTTMPTSLGSSTVATNSMNGLY